MLSYRHGFHAGNHADVLKHAVLALLLEALRRKATPFCCLDTHAGAGRYDLQGAEAQKNAEHESGIARLWTCPDLPEALQPYLAAVRALTPGEGTVRNYPGSPALARHFLRPGDRLLLCELHPAEQAALKALFAGDPQVAVHRQDGYQGLHAFLPPRERRGLVLVDPAYEVKSEYEQVVTALAGAVQRWPGGIYALWYPVLAENRHRRLLDALCASGMRRILQAELNVLPEREPRGMRGSGMVIINPPWQLDTTLEALLPWLWKRLSPEHLGGWSMEWLVPE